MELQRNYLEEFERAFIAGVGNLFEAARVYVEAIEDNPGLRYEFQERFEGIIPVEAWTGFEAVGRRWMHPNLLFGSGGRFSKQIRRLPFSLQETIFDGGRFDLLLADGDVLKVDVRNCTTRQAEQLFAGDHIRSLAEQKAFLCEQNTSHNSPPVVQMPYFIRRGRVVFRADTELTKRELRRVLGEMK